MQAADILIRPAIAGDADGISAVLALVVAASGSDRSSDPEHVRERYLEDRNRVRCSVATGADGSILGFQSLKRAMPDNPYGVTPGWGIIGTYVRPGLGRLGIGRRLFASSLEAAREAALPAIDATIGADNALGLAYYEAMGFRAYRRRAGSICKSYVLG
ncbi:GNAT family N-acetyltransferase [Rhizobium halophytocola]|uniref:Ribosomal protein S18 acetylase RimI-like enzyme n=1 Tax=Rhizobium halophytocola TaxID=735519 RepID=A0ABS4E634_9HYPH|nr:GNAT family N-acetyltransferase [Rhizobium halophytocola]MBP1853382.1 ribosomal protein S18 acetylase RimI-like enzyme [Rhizobium halophytocola]